MALLKNGELADDIYTDVRELEDIPPSGAILISLRQWDSQRDALLARHESIGIALKSDEKPELIAADLEQFDTIALEFPAFGDGRAYSYARLLRDRYGYAGELRAIGDVLLEQLHFMHRVGFDAFLIDSDDAISAWKTALADLSVWYQPTGDGRASAVELRHDSD
jgi:uncharacterized protein (DUF934 family)